MASCSAKIAPRPELAPVITAHPVLALRWFDISESLRSMLIPLTYINVNVVNMVDEQKRCDTYHHGDLKRALTDAALGLVAEKGQKASR